MQIFLFIRAQDFQKKLAKENLFNSSLTSPGFMVVIEESEEGIAMGR